jgi:hypothetical protein
MWLVNIQIEREREREMVILSQRFIRVPLQSSCFLAEILLLMMHQHLLLLLWPQLLFLYHVHVLFFSLFSTCIFFVLFLNSFHFTVAENQAIVQIKDFYQSLNFLFLNSFHFHCRREPSHSANKRFPSVSQLGLSLSLSLSLPPTVQIKDFSFLSVSQFSFFF